jgi:hypothetical protein
MNTNCTEKKKIFILVLTLFVATCVAAETDKNASSEKDAEKAGEKDQSKVEYWVIRSQALTELTPFLTKTRTEAKGHYNILTDYLKHIEKGQEFLDSNIKGSSSPAEYAKAIGKSEEFVEKNIELPDKPMTWTQLVEMAMEFIRQEGHIPTDIKDAEELEMFKKICQQKEIYGRKVRDELRGLAQNCMDMKAYLESIDQFEPFLKYARYQKEEKAKARKERMQKGREQLAAKERRRREQKKQNIWQERQNRLGNNYYRGRSYRYSYYRW